MTTNADLPPFQRLLDEHAGAVWRFLSARLRRDAAEDCYQETMLAALRAYPQLRDAANLRGWLFTIASRKIVDARRDVVRRPTATADPPERPAEDVDPTDDGLWRQVRALPDGQRDAIALRFAADLAYRDVGAQLGCSEEAARQRVRAGIARLRETMEDTE